MDRIAVVHEKPAVVIQEIREFLKSLLRVARPGVPGHYIGGNPYVVRESLPCRRKYSLHQTIDQLQYSPSNSR